MSIEYLVHYILTIFLHIFFCSRYYVHSDICTSSNIEFIENLFEKKILYLFYLFYDTNILFNLLINACSRSKLSWLKNIWWMVYEDNGNYGKKLNYCEIMVFRVLYNISVSRTGVGWYVLDNLTLYRPICDWRFEQADNNTVHVNMLYKRNFSNLQRPYCGLGRYLIQESHDLASVEQQDLQIRRLINAIAI